MWECGRDEERIGMRGGRLSYHSSILDLDSPDLCDTPSRTLRHLIRTRERVIRAGFNERNGQGRNGGTSSTGGRGYLGGMGGMPVDM